MIAMEKIKCKCGKDWKIQDNLSAHKGKDDTEVKCPECGETFNIRLV